MAVLFLDTSALVRRYFQPEPGANRVREACAPSHGHTIVLARIAAVELSAALHRRLRERTLTRSGLDRRWRQFLSDWLNQYEIAQAGESVYTTATALTGQYPLRAFDALQLASALAVAERSGSRGFEFWTADATQARAARSERLTVVTLR